jgi:hypothetical protein
VRDPAVVLFLDQNVVRAYMLTYLKNFYYFE